MHFHQPIICRSYLLSLSASVPACLSACMSFCLSVCLTPYRSLLFLPRTHNVNWSFIFSAIHLLLTDGSSKIAPIPLIPPQKRIRKYIRLLSNGLETKAREALAISLRTKPHFNADSNRVDFSSTKHRFRRILGRIIHLQTSAGE